MPGIYVLLYLHQRVLCECIYILISGLTELARTEFKGLASACRRCFLQVLGRMRCACDFFFCVCGRAKTPRKAKKGRKRIQWTQRHKQRTAPALSALEPVGVRAALVSRQRTRVSHKLTTIQRSFQRTSRQPRAYQRTVYIVFSPPAQALTPEPAQLMLKRQGHSQSAPIDPPVAVWMYTCLLVLHSNAVLHLLRSVFFCYVHLHHW